MFLSNLDLQMLDNKDDIETLKAKFKDLKPKKHGKNRERPKTMQVTLFSFLILVAAEDQKFFLAAEDQRFYLNQSLECKDIAKCFSNLSNEVDFLKQKKLFASVESMLTFQEQDKKPQDQICAELTFKSFNRKKSVIGFTVAYWRFLLYGLLYVDSTADIKKTRLARLISDKRRMEKCFI